MICNGRLCCQTGKARVLCILCFLLLAAAPLWAESKKSNWVLAASSFSGESDLCDLLPSLILSSLPDNLERTIDENEQRDRKLEETNKQLPSLVSELNNLVTKRDSVVLSNDSAHDKQEKIRDYETQIEEAKVKIEECRSLAALDSFVPEENLREPVTFYGDSSTALVSLSGSETNEELEAKAKNSFQALIQGSIIERSGYLFATVTVTRFPGNQLIGSCDALYPKTSANLLAEDIAQKLVNILVNKDPVTICLDVTNGSGKITVRMDGVPLANYTQPITTQAGIHHFTVEAEGCQEQGFTYDFGNASEYTVQVRLQPLLYLDLTVYSVTDKGLFQCLMGKDDDADDGETLGNSIYLAGGTSSASGAAVTVNGLPVLGETVTPDGVSTFFIINQPVAGLTGSAVQANIRARNDNSSQIIDKRRREMYTSFGLFLLTLPFSFLSYGRMGDYAAQIDGRYNSHTQNSVLWDGYYRWQKLSYLSSAISGGFGINWVFHLSRYILAANQVLPELVQAEELPEQVPLDAETSKIE